jgi:hypothetical protein
MSSVTSRSRHRFHRVAALASLALAFCVSAAQAQVLSPPKNISGNTTSNSSYPSMVVDANGNIDVAWIDSVSGINFARSTPASQSFTFPPAPVSPLSVGAAFQPQMVVDPTGLIIEIAWAKPSIAASAPSGTFDVLLSRSIDGGLNFITKQVSTTPVKLVDSPRLVFDGAGVVVVWGNTESWIIQSPDGVTFPNLPTDLSIAPQDSGGPRVAVDKNGNIFVAWTDRLAEDQNQPGNYCTNMTGTTDANGLITVVSNTFGGNLYLNETLSGSSSTPSSASTRNLSNQDWKGVDPRWPNGYFGCSYDNLQLFFDQNDTLHLLWADDAPTEELLTSTATQAGGSPLFKFPIALAGSEGASSPRAAADANGSIYVVWAAGAKAPSKAEGIYFSRSDNNGVAFPEASVISAPGAISPAFPQIALDSNGNVNIVWEQADQAITANSSNTFDVFFSHSTDRGDTFPTVGLASTNPSVLCIPPSTSGTPPTTPDTTTCGAVQMGVDANSNADMVWVNNPPGSGADIAFAVANVAQQPPNDFSISVSPASQTAYAGQTVTFNVTAQVTGTFNSAITLACNDFPLIKGFERWDFSCTFTPGSGSLTPGTSATVGLTLPVNLPAGPIRFAINGASGGTTHRVLVTANSQGPAGSVQPNSATLAVGASANFTVTITNPNAFTGMVNFLCAGQPAWIRCSFNPSSLNPSTSTSSVLTVSAVSAPSLLPSNPPAARRLPAHGSLILWSGTLAALCLIAMAMISMGRHEKLSEVFLLRGSVVLALTVVLGVGLISCGGAAAPSNVALSNSGGSGAVGTSGNSSGGGASNPVTATFMIQTQSGNGITNLGAVSITTP